ncbi:hypothetical protein HPP92_024612 [Vanilla planifolia]|uniref:Uncharacterized protein n=1 Tax=Vanilla planifolia TaxID=51239 RepID=A0A835UBP4_VANPL|nr:hypothetical protein HPP92_024612 [Vanilla planifolia]
MLRLPIRSPSRYSFLGQWPVTCLCLFNGEAISCSKTLSPTYLECSVSFFSASSGVLPSAAPASTKPPRRSIANVSILKDYGLTQSQIENVASRFPSVCSFHPEKCLRPKLEFFVAVGYSHTTIAKMITRNPKILTVSLKRRLRPNFELMRNLLGGDTAAAATVAARWLWILKNNPEKQILPNLRTLSEHGVTSTNIAKFVKWHPRSLTAEPGRFRESAALIKEMGFDPSKTLFVSGVHVLSGISQATWERNLLVYRNLGWSHEEIISAFRKNPVCMVRSEKKIRKVMDFFKDNLQWQPSHFASLPTILGLHLEKRIVPRYVVFKSLAAKGLLGNRLNFKSVLFISESSFLNKYVLPYSDQFPDLFEAYKGKLKLDP